MAPDQNNNLISDPNNIDNYNSIKPYIKKLYTNTWFSQEYLSNVVHITKGSGAGTPLADGFRLCIWSIKADLDHLTKAFGLEQKA